MFEFDMTFHDVNGVGHFENNGNFGESFYIAFNDTYNLLSYVKNLSDSSKNTLSFDSYEDGTTIFRIEGLNIANERELIDFDSVNGKDLTMTVQLNLNSQS